MKLLSALAWLSALMLRRRSRPADPDPADMGTELGLDSITLRDASLPSQWPPSGRAPSAWEQRLTRRSRL